MALDDVRERVGDAASTLTRRVREDVQAGERAAREQTQRARRRVREVDARAAVGRGADALASDGSLSSSPPSTRDAVVERAAAAAEAPAPVDATLAPVTRPELVQENARAGLDGAAEMAAMGGLQAEDPNADEGMHAASEMAMLGTPPRDGADGDGGQTPADMATMGWGSDGEADGQEGWF